MLKILYYPKEKLRIPCKPYQGRFGIEIKKLASQMFKTMRHSDGVGLSANQVGLDLCLTVIDVREALPPKAASKFKPIILVNPKIVKKSSKKILMEEGCLSFPNLYGDVLRPEKVSISFQNELGKQKTLKAKGLLARVLQHEYDHLQGSLFIDKVEPGSLKEIRPEEICQNLNIVFVGTSIFGLPTLKELIKHKMIPKLIITEKDKPAGRGQKLTSSPVKEFAKKFHLPLLEPEKISQSINAIKKVEPDCLIVASYGQIIPKSILNLPKIALNLHPSLLPKFRGPSPIASAILAGEKKTGLTIIVIDEKIDHGPIIPQKKVAIDPKESAPDLEVKLANLAAQMTISTLKNFSQNRINLKKQNERFASQTHKFSKEDGKIDWSKGAIAVNQQIRALDPWPGTYTEIAGKRLKIIKAHIEDENLIIDQVQPEGKKIMDFNDFLNGAPKLLDFFKKISYIKID